MLASRVLSFLFEIYQASKPFNSSPRPRPTHPNYRSPFSKATLTLATIHPQQDRCHKSCRRTAINESTSLPLCSPKHRPSCCSGSVVSRRPYDAATTYSTMRRQRWRRGQGEGAWSEADQGPFRCDNVFPFWIHVPRCDMVVRPRGSDGRSFWLSHQATLARV
jgi:hypothetical protein